MSDMNGKYIADSKRAFGLFALCWTLYGCSYLGRQNYSSVMAEMVLEGLMTKGQAGLVNTVFYIFYAAGQLINGMLGDRYSPRWMLFIGSCGAGLCNLLGPLADNYALILLLRALNGYFMAMLWPPMIRVFGQMLLPRDRVRYTIHMTSAMAAGSLGAYLLSSAMLTLTGLQGAFVLPGLLLVGMSVVWLVAFGRLEAYWERSGQPSEEELAQPRQPEATDSLSYRRMLFIPGVLIALGPVVLHGMIKDGVTSWIPAYVTEIFHVEPAFAALVTTLLPIVNLTGAAAAKFVYERICRSEFGASAIFFGIATAALSVLLTLGDMSLAVTLVCFALVTSSTLAINTLFVSILPLRFVRYGRASTLSGTLNAVAYAGSAGAAAAIGFLSERFGWGANVASWLISMALALVMCIAGRHARMLPKGADGAA
ncbi:MAG: MFS transporter [Clostridiales bacterium]|nr:MFS transporter [Clostridiales bacterium]